MPNTVKGEVIVRNKHGLHMRAAGQLCAIASKFASKIQLTKNRKRIDAKSMLDIMSLSAAPGSKLTITATGDDATQALAAVQDFFQTYPEDR